MDMNVINTMAEEDATVNEYDVGYYTNKVYDLFVRLDRQGLLFAPEEEYTRDGIHANVKEWYEKKKDLFTLFRNHPNWVEEAKAIVFTSTERRLPDANIVYDYSYRIINNIPYDNFLTYANSLPDDAIEYRDKYASLSERTNLARIIDRITDMESLNSLSEDVADYINKLYPIHAVKGQKTSRVLNKLFCLFGADKADDYNRQFAKLADACNPLDIERITVFSLNIIDFLLMSNGNSWRSCHTIINDGGDNNYGGCYKGGTLSYATDSTSLIMYTVSKDYTGADWCFEPKIMRQVFFWDYPVLVQERLYPQENDDTKQGKQLNDQYRQIAEEIFSTCYNVPNLWVIEKKNRARIFAKDDTYMYHDWDHFDNHIVHLKKEVKISDSEIEEYDDSYMHPDYVIRSAKHIAVGGRSFCIKCGSQKIDDYSDYDDNNGENSLLCVECCGDGDRVRCADCGDIVDREDAIYDEDSGEYYCHDCCEYCEYHEEYEHRELTYVEEYGDVCDDALDSDSSFYHCYNCGRWFHEGGTESLSDYRGHTICLYCFESDYAECEECGEIYPISEMDEIDGSYYCHDCAEEMADDEAV